MTDSVPIQAALDELYDNGFVDGVECAVNLIQGMADKHLPDSRERRIFDRIIEAVRKSGEDCARDGF